MGRHGTHTAGQGACATSILLSTTMILVGYSFLRFGDHPRRGEPADEQQQPQQPAHALLSLLNRDQYGDRPLLYGAYYSAPPEGVTRRSTVYYLDEDGKYKTASGHSRDTPTLRNSFTLPRMWDARRTRRNTRSGPPTAPRPRHCATTRAKSCATRRDVPCDGETLDFGPKGLHRRVRTRTVTEPTFWRTSTSSSTTSSRTCTGATFMWNFVGRQSDVRVLRARRSRTATGCRVSTPDRPRFSSGRRTTCRSEQAPKTRAGTRTTSCRSCWDSSDSIYQLNRDRPQLLGRAVACFVMTGVALAVYLNSTAGRAARAGLRVSPARSTPSRCGSDSACLASARPVQAPALEATAAGDGRRGHGQSEPSSRRSWRPRTGTTTTGRTATMARDFG